jgi:hypothetical protein
MNPPSRNVTSNRERSTEIVCCAGLAVPGVTSVSENDALHYSSDFP